jgi:hypothetical protein
VDAPLPHSTTSDGRSATTRSTRGPAPGGGQHVVGWQHGVQVLQRFQLPERLLDLFLDLYLGVGFDPPHRVQDAGGLHRQVADPAGQVEVVPDQQQQPAKQQPQRHQGHRRHRARAGGQPQPERARQPRGDQHGYRLGTHQPEDHPAHGGLLYPAAFLRRSCGPTGDARFEIDEVRRC